jgi:uncharacterized protein Yka (UPF0111/DUF47 family)
MVATKLLQKAKNMRLLPPRDREFYALFNEMTEVLVEGSTRLVELFSSEGPVKQEIGIRIETCLNRCSRIGESIEEMLRSSQQPPFGRAEISEFGSESFRVMKFINHAANRFVVYDLPYSDKEMRELAPLIQEACQELAKAAKLLPKDRNLGPCYRAVDLLEARADVIYHEGLRRRFQEIRSDRANLESRIAALTPEAVMKEIIPILSANMEYTRHAAVFFILRQVYEELERAIDACTEVAASLKRMVAENV